MYCYSYSVNLKLIQDYSYIYQNVILTFLH